MADVPSVQVYRYTNGGAIVDEKKQTQHAEYRRGRGWSPGVTGTFLAHMLDLYSYVIYHVPTSAPAHITENARLRLYILAHG
jgi:hypothetical protein